MKKRVTKPVFGAIETWIRKEDLRIRKDQPLATAGLVQAACLDGTDGLVWSSRDPHGTGRGVGDTDARVSRFLER